MANIRKNKSIVFNYLNTVRTMVCGQVRSMSNITEEIVSASLELWHRLDSPSSFAPEH